MYIKLGKPKPCSKKELGTYGEQFAAKYLCGTLGWSISVRNWRCRSGEIDIVGISKHDIVLVEVRTKRINGRFGTPVESVDARKIRQIQRVGRIYAGTLPARLQEYAMRYDLIALQIQNDTIIDFRHYRNITCL